MSSRKELKEQRRHERLERERAEQRSSQRRRRLQYAFGGILAAALVAGAVVGITVLAGSGDGGPTGSASQAGLPKLPQQVQSDWRKAAQTAGCKLTNARHEGAGHAEKQFKPSDYKTNPPTSGEHFPQWAEDGIYAAGDTPELGELVHTLEHGRVNIQYRKGSSTELSKKLEALVAEQNDGYHLLLYENATDMPYEVAATGWTQLLGCERYSDKALDALRTFTARYIDKGPERVP